MITMIIGGASSGKSAFAEQYITQFKGNRYYVATMEVMDAESEKRVEKHRLQRQNKGFSTVECPLGLAQKQWSRQDNVLLECISNLVANERFSPFGNGIQAVLQGLDVLCAQAGNVTIVTNELFVSGADYDAETLAYLKDLATVNRALAKRADMVYEIVCGIPNQLKGSGKVICSKQ